MHGLLFLIRLLIYLFRASWAHMSAIGGEKWPTADAIVTADPARLEGLAGFAVEFPYSYRFEGELYTGLHEEPSFGGLGSELMERFTEGRHFIVRVKPTAPEVSIVLGPDQTDRIPKGLERIDEAHRRDLVRKGP